MNSGVNRSRSEQLESAVGHRELTALTNGKSIDLTGIERRVDLSRNRHKVDGEFANERYEEREQMPPKSDLPPRS